MGETSDKNSYRKFRLFDGGSSAPHPETRRFLICGLGVGQTFGGKAEVLLAWNRKSGLPSALFLLAWLFHLRARSSGLASPSLPTGEGEATTVASTTQHALILRAKPATRSTGSEERPTFLGGSDERPSTTGADEGEISLT